MIVDESIVSFYWCFRYCHLSWTIAVSISSAITYALLHLASLAMLFIHALACSASAWKNNIVKDAEFDKKCVSKLWLGLYDIGWYTECNGPTYVVIPHWFVKWSHLFVNSNNIWQIMLYSYHFGIYSSQKTLPRCWLISSIWLLSLILITFLILTCGKPCG